MPPNTSEGFTGLKQQQRGWLEHARILKYKHAGHHIVVYLFVCIHLFHLGVFCMVLHGAALLVRERHEGSAPLTSDILPVAFI